MSLIRFARQREIFFTKYDGVFSGDIPFVYGSMDFKEWYFIGLGFTDGGKNPQGNSSRRRDCHFADIHSPSRSKLPSLVAGEGEEGAACRQSSCL